MAELGPGEDGSRVPGFPGTVACPAGSRAQLSSPTPHGACSEQAVAGRRQLYIPGLAARPVEEGAGEG